MDSDLCVLFALNGRTYGLEAVRVLEVMGFRPLTPLPDPEPGVKGVISLRGAIVPVVDLRSAFRLPATAYSRFHVILVVDVAGRRVGLIADEIIDVTRMPRQELQAVASLPPGLPAHLVAALGHTADKPVVLLCLDGLLDPGPSTRGERRHGQDSDHR
ncbi:MAG: chemotaxis protein CheW [Thermodesulfobacteriota bacterium]